MIATEKQTIVLVRRLTVSEAVAGRLIAAGFFTVKRARVASVAQLTAIEGINTAKANAIRAGQ